MTLPNQDPFPAPWKRVSWETGDGRVIHRVEAMSYGKPLVVCYVDTVEQAEAIVASKNCQAGVREVQIVQERMERLRRDLSHSQEAMRQRLQEEIRTYAEALESARERIKELEQAQQFELTP